MPTTTAIDLPTLPYPQAAGKAMRFELLGPLRIVDHGIHTISAPKMATFLAAMLIRADRPVSTDDLKAELWGEESPRNANASLHVYVSRLRKNFFRSELDGPSIETQVQGYMLRTGSAAIDSAQLQDLYRQGRSLMATRPDRALEHFEEAVRSFRGPVLQGIGTGAIVGAFVRWVEEVRLECIEAIAWCSLRAGRHREVIGDLSRWSDEFPLNETLRENLMLALHRCGRRAEALDVFHDTRKILREELGLDPRHSMRQLQSAILDAG
jgi:DNA-binding SARP family transcriptional activator